MKTNLVLMRHGQSMANAGIPINHEEQNILTEHGIMEAMRLAKTFRAVFPDLQFDHAFSSPLHRALQTNLNFLSVINNKAIDTQIVPAFTERSLGFNGFMKIKDMIAKFGQDELDRWERDVFAIPGDARGEALMAVYDRVVDAYEYLVMPRLRAGETVLITAHYYVLKVLQSHIQYGNVYQAPLYDPRNALPVAYQIAV